MSLSETVVEVRDLTKRYGDHILAVDRISLTVRRGEVYGFLGPNGAGKTTTLRMLLGLISPTSGDIGVLGQRPGTPESLARVGSLIEEPAFYPYLSGRHNLRVVARYGSVPSGQIGDRVEDALRTVDLAGRADDRFATYSLGMKQRLGVAAALLNDPELVVLDEPTNGLDPAGMRDMRGLIRELGTEGRTVLLSSHLLGEVQQICDRVAVINNGRIVTEGTVEELRGDAELVVAATPSDVAMTQLASLPEVRRVYRSDGKLRVQVDTCHTALVNRTLVEAGVAVTELRRAERQLEDVFFEVTQSSELSHV
jgi:ABC-2 type transport system ATP-binding protein